MNYHIITQDKFFDAYVEDIYKLQQEANNIFWVRGEKGEMSWLNTNHPIEYLGNEKKYYVSKLKTLKPEDKLFVSWYDMFIGEAILESGIKSDIYVSVMGGDFYAEPFWYHANWLFDKNTLKHLKNDRYYGFPHINWKRRLKNWRHVYDEICIRLAFMPQQRQLYQQKLNQIKRINYLILPKEDNAEYSYISKLYHGIKSKFVYGSYAQNYDAATLLPTNFHKQGELINILLGNSADPSNNYFDAFEWLNRQIKNSQVPIRIHTILSYGDRHNRELVLERGKLLFGENFVPVLSFMSREEYLSFLNNMDTLIMFHNRQQAVGNMMTAITLGKPVLMKANNPIFTMLKEQGCNSVYNVKEVKFNDVEKIILSANEERGNNADVVKRIYSEKTRLNDWRRIL